MNVYDSIHAMMDDHKNNKDKKDMHLKPYELCEIQILRARCLEMKGEPKKAIKFLTKKSTYSLLINQVARNELLARLYAQNNQNSKAIEMLEELLKLNSCCHNYYLDILKAHGVDLKNPAEHEAKIIEVLEKYEETLPKSDTHLRLQLNLIRHDNAAFKAKLKKYMKPMIVKGVPSVINDLSDFYNDAGKAKAIGELLDGF